VAEGLRVCGSYVKYRYSFSRLGFLAPHLGGLFKECRGVACGWHVDIRCCRLRVRVTRCRCVDLRVSAAGGFSATLIPWPLLTIPVPYSPA
jgi:hypothetical protein